MRTASLVKIATIFLFCFSSWTVLSQEQTEKSETMNTYLLQGKLVAKEGQAKELAAILIRASKLISTAKGSVLYVVSKDTTESNAVFVTEIWTSKEDHDNSLKVEGVRELIMQAMPLLAEQPKKGREMEILGGTGDLN